MQPPHRKSLQRDLSPVECRQCKNHDCEAYVTYEYCWKKKSLWLLFRFLCTLKNSRIWCTHLVQSGEIWEKRRDFISLLPKKFVSIQYLKIGQEKHKSLKNVFELCNIHQIKIKIKKRNSTSQHSHYSFKSRLLHQAAPLSPLMSHSHPS